MWLKTVLTLALVSLAGYVLDRLLRHEGITPRELLILSDLLVGLVAAILMFIVGRYQEQRSRFVATRLQVIAEMNHHIRNALQVIALQTHFGKNEHEIGAMQEAVRRITWALSEVLPQLPDFKSEQTELTKAASAHGEETGAALH